MIIFFFLHYFYMTFAKEILDKITAGTLDKEYNFTVK